MAELIGGYSFGSRPVDKVHAALAAIREKGFARRLEEQPMKTIDCCE